MCSKDTDELLPFSNLFCFICLHHYNYSSFACLGCWPNDLLCYDRWKVAISLIKPCNIFFSFEGISDELKWCSMEKEENRYHYWIHVTIDTTIFSIKGPFQAVGYWTHGASSSILHYLYSKHCVGDVVNIKLSISEDLFLVLGCQPGSPCLFYKFYFYALIFFFTILFQC